MYNNNKCNSYIHIIFEINKNEMENVKIKIDFFSFSVFTVAFQPLTMFFSFT